MTIPEDNMYTIEFCANNESDHGLYNYSAVGSLDQVISGALIKSVQIPLLQDKQWLVLIKQNGKIIATRAVKSGSII